MKDSLWKLVSIGIVAANKPLDSHNVEITPIEHLTFLDGELTDNLETNTVAGVDDAGGSYQVTAKSSATVTALWKPMSSNRATAPDVRRGEKVHLWRYADDPNQYYWSAFEYRRDLRKLETIILTMSGTQDEAATPGPENEYSLEFSTHQKTITAQTTKANGEPFAYTLQLNTDRGYFVIQDDIGNYWTVDSAANRIEFKNADGSHIDMDRKNIRIYAPDSIFMRADNNITLDAGNDMNVKVGNNQTTDVGSVISTTSGGLNTTKASEIKTQANTTTNTVPLTTFSGNVTVGMMLTTMSFGGGAGGGTFNVQCPGTFTQTVTLQSTTTIQKIVTPSRITGPGFD